MAQSTKTRTEQGHEAEDRQSGTEEAGAEQPQEAHEAVEVTVEPPPEGGNGTAAAEGAEGTTLAELQAELDALRAEAEAEREQRVRLQADLENYKKRMQREHEERWRYRNLELLSDLLTVMDNMERALDAARKEEGQADSALVTGFEMVVKGLAETFERYGLQNEHPVGQPFDPTRHEAVGVVETDETPEGLVVDVYRTGYLLQDRVVRPAMVTVAKPAGGGQPGGPGAGETEQESNTE